MSAPSADQDLLFGLLAWQLHFLSRDQLTAALAAWAADKSRPLAEVLREQGALGDDELGLLANLARRHLARHRHDLHQSLATLATPSSFGRLLEHIADEAIQATLNQAVTAPLVDPDHSRDPDGGGNANCGTLASPGKRFRVLRPHAKGGLGQVSVALDGELNREVALKEIQPQYADHPESRSRFLLEAEVTGGLEHPGVVPVYSLGKHPDGRPFYAMRFIRGDSLKDAIDRFHKDDKPGRDPGERSLALRQLLGRFVDVCEAMAYAHSRGVIHRDLKPANVMLGKYGETLVVDWGLAKPLGERQTSEEFAERTLRPVGAEVTPQTHGTVGTPSYMSPEQAAGRLDLVGPASDVYSLGATLYTLLTGEPSVGGLTLEAMLRRVQEGDFPAPRQVKAGIHPALEAVCLKAMALKPVDRYASAKELAEDVEHWLAGEPVKAWPEPWRVRAGRWLKRHRTLVSSGVAALVVAILTLVVFTALLTAAYENVLEAKGKETDAKEEALKQKKRADDNFAKAKKAVENYLTKVADHPKFRENDLHGLRKELLQTAVPFYDDFVKQNDSDPALQADRGRAYERLAFLRAELGETERALRDYEVMRDIFAGLAEAHRGVSEYREALARSQNALGVMCRDLSKLAEAEAAFGEALKSRRALAAANPHVPGYRHDLAQSHNSLGALLYDLGKRGEAEAAYREARGLLQALAAAYPREPSYCYELAQSHNNLGILLRDLGKPGEAEAAYREALGPLRGLAAEHRQEPYFRYGLAQVYNNLGILLRDLGERDEAEAACSEALKLCQDLAVANPHVPDYRQGLAECHNSLGAVFGDMGKHLDSVAAYREAVELYKALAADSPRVPDHRRELARGHDGLGEQFDRLGKHPESEAAFREALRLLQALAKAHPRVPGYREDLGRSHNNLGNLLVRADQLRPALAELDLAVTLLDELRVKDHLTAQGRAWLGDALRARASALDGLRRHTDAAKDWQWALPLMPDSKRAQARARLAFSLARAGDHAQAAATAETLVKGNTSHASHYSAACALALSAAAAKDDEKLSETYAARAVALLSGLHAGGYFGDEKNATRLKKDADLDPLRQRDDFRKLLAQVEKAP
jgi:serine/threonine-protein kinase